MSKLNEAEARELIRRASRRHFPDWPAKDYDYLVELYFEVAKKLSGFETRNIAPNGYGIFQMHHLTFREIKICLLSRGIQIRSLFDAGDSIEAAVWYVRFCYDKMPAGVFSLREKLYLSMLGAFCWSFKNKMTPALLECRKKHGVIDGGLVDMPPVVEEFALMLRHCEINATHRTSPPKVNLNNNTYTEEELCLEPV